MTDQTDVDSRDADEQTSRDDDHLADVEPGAGCTEVWEHLSELRSRDETDEE